MLTNSPNKSAVLDSLERTANIIAMEGGAR
jgi:hypothetical protein